MHFVDFIPSQSYHFIVNERQYVIIAGIFILLCSIITGIYLASFFPGILSSVSHVPRNIVIILISSFLTFGFWFGGSFAFSKKMRKSFHQTLILDAYSFLPVLLILNIPIFFPRFDTILTKYYSCYINSLSPKIALFLLILFGNLAIKAFLFCNLSGFYHFIEKKEKLILTLLLILYFTYFMYTGLADYHIFGNFHDLCRNTQIYYTLMKGEFYTSRLHSDTNQKVYSLFCDHFKPSMVFFTPLFLLVPRPETLLFIKTLLMTLGGIPLYFLCRHFIDPLSSLLFTMNSLFVAPYAAQMYTGFHSSNFAPLFIFFTVLFYHKKQFKWFNTFMILTASIKENLPFMLIMFAPIAFLQKREKKWIIATLLICILWTALTFYVIFPAFRVQDSTYGGSYPYSRIDKMVAYLFGTVLNPAKIISELNQAGRFEFMFLMLAPLLFIMPFFSRYVLLAIPGLLSLTVLMNWNTPITFHHPIESTAFLFASTIFVLNNISNLKKIPFIEGKDAVKILCLLMFMTVWIQSPIWFGTKKKAPDPHYEYQKELFKVVPRDVTLATPTYLTAFFSAQDEVFYLNRDAIKPGVGAEYIIIDLEIVSSPIEDEINKSVKEKGGLDNYDLIWNKGPLYLFKTKK